MKIARYAFAILLLASSAFALAANASAPEISFSLRGVAGATVEQGDANASLMRVVAELSERDQVVIALYYFEGLTLAEIGRVLGVTESRISQVHSRATASLRAKLLAMETA